LVPELKIVQHPHRGHDEGKHLDAIVCIVVTIIAIQNDVVHGIVVRRSKNVYNCIERLRVNLRDR